MSTNERTQQRTIGRDPLSICPFRWSLTLNIHAFSEVHFGANSFEMNFADWCTNELEFRIYANCKNNH